MDNQLSKQPNILLIIFMVFQIVFAILISISFSNVFVDNELPSYTFNATTMAHIQNLTEAFPDLPPSVAEALESNLFYVISSNSANRSISQADVEANILTDTIKTVYFEHQNVNFLSATVDVPALEQSYRIFQEYSADPSNPYIDDTRSSAILCPMDDDILYPEAKCAKVYTFYERPQIVASVISYFFFESFSLYIEPNNPNTIIINPLNLDIDESTKTNYIGQVKFAIESLGIPSDLFNFHIIEPSEITYDIDLGQ